MPKPPTCDELMDKWEAREASFSEPMNLRVRRSISWICRAEREKEKEAEEKVGYSAVRFILLWVAFNAAYADREKRDARPPNKPKKKAKKESIFIDYFKKIVPLDSDKRIYNAIWHNFEGPIRLLTLENQYVFEPFWKYHNGVAGYQNWRSRFDKSKRGFNSAIARQDTCCVLDMVFERLYVLRNQLIHGGATWNKTKGYHQVEDGVAILDFLVPIFVDLMIDNPHPDPDAPDRGWGKPFYPFVDGGGNCTGAE